MKELAIICCIEWTLHIVSLPFFGLHGATLYHFQLLESYQRNKLRHEDDIDPEILLKQCRSLAPSFKKLFYIDQPATISMMSFSVMLEFSSRTTRAAAMLYTILSMPTTQTDLISGDCDRQFSSKDGTTLKP